TEELSRQRIESDHAVRGKKPAGPHNGGVEVAVRPEGEAARAVKPKAAGQDPQEIPRGSIIAQHRSIALHAADVEVAIWPECHAIREEQPAAARGDKGAGQGPCRRIEAQDRAAGDVIVAERADIEKTVTSEDQLDGLVKRWGTGWDEGVDECSRCPVVAQNSVATVTDHIKVAVRPERHAAGLDQIVAGRDEYAE